MKEIYATTRIRRRDIAEGRYMGSSLRDSTMRDLARGLAEELLKVMELRETTDPATGDLVVRAGVYVAERREVDDRYTPTYLQRKWVNMIEPPKIRPDMNLEGYINMLPGVEIKITDEPITTAPANQPPAFLTQEKLNEAVEQLRGQIFPKDNDLYMSMINPMTYLEERMNRKRAAAEGEASAVAKARGEKEVRENTKKRGSTVTIEVGVRKITMPDKKEAG